MSTKPPPRGCRAAAPTPCAFSPLFLPPTTMSPLIDESAAAALNAQNAYFPHISGGTGGSGGAAGHEGGKGGDGLGPGFMITAQTVSQSIFYNIADPNTPKPAPPAADLVDTSCPPPSMYFQGRQSILSRLQDCFGSTSIGGQIIVVLHGVGGIGKTQTALRYIEESSTRFKMNFKIDATSTDTIETSFKNIAKNYNLPDTAAAALTWLKSQREEWILLFDNADNIKLDLQPYIPHCAHGNILITSRNPALGIYTRRTGRSIELSNLDLDAAISLFVDIAGVNLQENNNRAQVTRLMQEIYCFPLAIVHSAAYISRYAELQQDVSQYLAIHKQNKQQIFAQQSLQASGDYKFTVFTTWKISFEELSPKTQQFLQLCSFLPEIAICEEVFKRATEHQSSRKLDNPALAQAFLAGFRNSNNTFSAIAFKDQMTSICSYSLMSWGNKSYAMHPLLRDWVQSTSTEQDNLKLTAANILTIAAGSYFAEKKYVEACELQEQVLELKTQLFGSENVSTAAELVLLGALFTLQGKYSEAKPMMQKGLDLHARLLGNDNPLTVAVTEELATVHYKLEEYREALPLFNTAYQEHVLIQGPKHEDTLLSLTHIAWCHSKLQHNKDAAETMQKVLDLQKQLSGNEHSKTLQAMADAAELYSKAQQHTQAQALAVPLCEIRTRLQGPTHMDTLAAEKILFGTYVSLEEKGKAATLARAIYNKQLPIVGPKHEEVISMKLAYELNEATSGWQMVGIIGKTMVQGWWSSR
uniref:Nephrocystin-3 n=1 Tax=Mycena chlorophos TaxID=658473 RepID=A0ABQ0LWW4_MYCCL|nr:nephrocystin-3 [Mycena chlorophos]